MLRIYSLSSAIHDYSADKPQTKMRGRGGKCLIKIGKNKKRKKICGLKIKLKESTLCLFLSL